MDKRQAQEKEAWYKGKLIQLKDWMVEFTLTFGPKLSFMWRYDYSNDRINEAKDMTSFLARALKVRKKAISLFIKDEHQGHGHLHGLIGGKVFKEKNINATTITKAMKAYWEGSLKKDDDKEKKSSDWVKDKQSKVVNPNKGWCYSRSLVNKPRDDFEDLIGYASKFTKGGIVVGVNVATNDVLTRRMNEVN